MTGAESVIGLVLSVLAVAYLVYALAVPGEALMTGAAWLQLLVLIVLLAISTPLLGTTWRRSTAAARRPATACFRPVERLIYRVCGVDPRQRAALARRTRSRCSRSASSSVLVLYAQLRLQGHLPLNPDHLGGVEARRCRSTPRSASSPTRTGRTTRASRRCRTSPRWPASRCTTSCRPRPAPRSRSR